MLEAHAPEQRALRLPYLWSVLVAAGAPDYAAPRCPGNRLALTTLTKIRLASPANPNFSYFLFLETIFNQRNFI